MKNEMKGELSIFLSCALFSAVTISIKLLASSFSGQAISLVRFIVGLLLGSAAIVIFQKKKKLYLKKDLFLRGLFGAISMTAMYLAITHSSSGRATLLGSTYPVFVGLFGFIFYGEEVKLSNIFALVFCLSGAFFVFYDGSSYSPLGDIFAIVSSLSAGFALHYVRRSVQKNNPYVVYMSPCLFGLVLTASSAGEIVRSPLLPLFLVACIGALSFVAQIFMSWGYRHVTAIKGSIIGFSEIFFTVTASYFIGEKMNSRFMMGAVFILAGLMINLKPIDIVKFKKNETR